MAHRIYPHGPIRVLAPTLWEVTARHGLPIQRNMAIARLGDGGLLLHSCVALSEPGMAELEGLGSPSVLAVPHAMHAMDVPFYLERYPDMRVVCPQASQADLLKRRGVTTDGLPDALLAEHGVVATLVPGARCNPL